MKNFQLILCYSLALTLSGCASTEKAAPVPLAELKTAVSEVAGLMKEADIVQADLLSHDEYVKGSKYLANAQRSLSGSQRADYILEKAALGKAQFRLALENSKARTPNAFRILEARHSALDAGLKGSQDLADALADVDDDLRDETDDFARALEPKEFSEFQRKYFALEIKAVQFRELDDVKKAIQKAVRQDAEDLAPESLRAALLDVSEAENLIAQSPRNPKVHEDNVTWATESSVLLTDVMDVILNARGTPEDIALKIVKQNRELAKLSEDVGSLKQNLQSTQSSLMEKEGVLKQQNQELESTRSNLQETESALLLQNQELEKSSTQVRFQRAMDQAVQEFPDDEAAVYQQGSKLIFRLKKMNFATGSATIPAASKSMLKKVNDIIRFVGAEIVAVEGHTDSVGSNKINKDLSTKRAISVADYLASLAGGYKIGYIGYGESRPIASNETKEGRAINRRVDLVVTAKK
ncbi:MAG: OmpA family protein [Gammaproteobacteria bacterium]|nr:OmpA family protein [Gammaproteobacteria bacterium]MBT8436999.1 OmpA family protein [Gammaproteobacteria bacterium]